MRKKAIIAAAISFMFLASTVPVMAKDGQWKHDGTGWWYQYSDGSYVQDDMVRIDGKYYYFNDQGYMQTGWQKVWGDDYYFLDNGERARCQWVGNKWIAYYGYAEWDWWVDNGRYYVDTDGNWDPSKGTRVTSWKHDGVGWWFDTGDGSYAQDVFMELDREYYYFDEKGYMVTGWHDFGGWWGYYGDDGIERHNQWVGEYWVDEYGEMAIDCWVDDDKYYVGKDGKWIPDYGVQKWNQDANGWWYSNGDGTYPKSEVKKIDGQDYYFNDQGYMQTGWVKLADDYWVYFGPDGAMWKNRWQGDYWLKDTGQMAASQWVDGDKYYVGPDGKWIPGFNTDRWVDDSKGRKYIYHDETNATGACNIDGKAYYFDDEGYLIYGWHQVKDMITGEMEWAYSDQNTGEMYRNKWCGDYWLDEFGIMAVNCWVDDNKYYVGADGKWIPNYTGKE